MAKYSAAQAKLTTVIKKDIVSHMTTLAELETYVKAKGACHYKEVAAWFAIEPAEAGRMLGELVGKGKLAVPWASMQGPFVWYRHSSVPFNRSAGTMRNESRALHPEVWPVKHAKRRKRRHEVSGRPSRVDVGEQRDQAVLDYLTEHGPDTIAGVVKSLGLAYSTARRALGVLEHTGRVYRSDHISNGGVGRPTILWAPTPNGTADSAPVPVGDDDDDWRRVVQVVEE